VTNDWTKHIHHCGLNATQQIIKLWVMDHATQLEFRRLVAIDV